MKLNNQYWQRRYEANDAVWNAGKITTPLKDYFDQIKDKSISILIPGCGNAYEFEYLLDQEFTTISVLDYAQAPIDNIKKRIPNSNPNQLILGDFFEHTGQYDLIIEQTFFCAIDPQLRTNYIEKMHALLRPNGKLVGLLFQFPLTQAGPPFGGSKEEYINLFSEKFTIKTLETAYNSIQPRQGNELFFIFTKK
jgi:methyl halide transferase